MDRCPACGAYNKGRQTCGACGSLMTPASPADTPTATRRVSTSCLSSWIERAEGDYVIAPWNEDFVEVMLDLRDSRASEAALRTEIVELKRRLEAAEAKLADAERAGMERAMWIAVAIEPLAQLPQERISQRDMREKIVAAIRAAMPAASSKTSPEDGKKEAAHG